jgi:Ca-activated chloride channel family protein
MLILCILTASLLFRTDAYSQTQGADDRTLSPYFMVVGDDADLDRLPLKSTRASVKIAGVIADVQVTQVYHNEGIKPLEAVYVFPASTRAAVYGMKMTIGKRTIEAGIKKRQDARLAYEQARDEGRSASLLEQQRPNVFQMNVANILPGDEIRVELKYTELVVPEDRVYEFVYPTVTGPRYTGAGSEPWAANPYLHQRHPPAHAFDIQVGIHAGMPIREVSCPSHKVQVAYRGAETADVFLDRSESEGGNRDFILRYRLDGERIQSGLLLSEGGKENFFLLMVQPPQRVKKTDIPGREYIFIVDVSGSMHGFPLDISKQLLRTLIGGLRPSDRVNVLRFAGSASVLSEESLPATEANIAKAVQTIDNQKGGGGTELLPALKRALGLKRSDGFARTVVIVTDGYVTVEEEAFDLIRNNLGSANMFAFGIGTSVNRHLIEGLAHVGMGEPFVITRTEAAGAQAERFRGMIASPVLTQVRVRFRGLEAYDIEPVSIPDVLAERPVMVFGKWRGRPSGTITISGITGEGAVSESVDVASARPSRENEALRYLWARHRITVLSDYNRLRPDDSRIGEVTRLGLDYNLLTAYTSFVAVDTLVRTDGLRPTTVKQPLPLPQGVSDYAVKGSMAPCSRAGSGLIPAEEMQSAPAGPGKTKKQDKVAQAPVRIADIRVPKGMSGEAVRSTVQAHLPEIEACWPSTMARVTITLTIRPDGTVKEVQTMPGNALPCLKALVKKWSFTRPTASGETRVTITLVMGAS